MESLNNLESMMEDVTLYQEDNNSNLLNTISFSKWNGNDGIANFIQNKTNCKPFSGAGINFRKDEKTVILKSVDNTFYYDDNLDDPLNVEYSLFGQIGNQHINEKKFNEPLLNQDKTKKIFLYRVNYDKANKENKYIWYGKYKIDKITQKKHIDINKNLRIIYILHLKKIEN
jgi:hypothetical protein